MSRTTEMKAADQAGFDLARQQNTDIAIELGLLPPHVQDAQDALTAELQAEYDQVVVAGNAENIEAAKDRLQIARESAHLTFVQGVQGARIVGILPEGTTLPSIGISFDSPSAIDVHVGYPFDLSSEAPTLYSGSYELSGKLHKVTLDVRGTNDIVLPALSKRYHPFLEKRMKRAEELKASQPKSGTTPPRR